MRTVVIKPVAENKEMLRIFAVDDEILAIDYLKAIMEECKTDCTLLGFSTNSAAALTSIRQLKPDIAIIDINLPGMSGIEVAAELLKTERDLKIIFLTSFRDFDYVKKGMELGISAYILKNELSAESLDRELNKVVGKLEEERKLRRKYVNASLRNYLLRIDSAFEQAERGREADDPGGKAYRMLYIVRKRSFGLQKTNEEPGYINIEDFIYRQETEIVKPYCAANIKDNTWCVLYRSAAEGEEGLQENVWRFFNEHGIETLIVSTPGPVSLQELPSLYDRMSAVDERRLFYGEERFLSLDALKEMNQSRTDFDFMIQRIGEAILRQDRNQLHILYRELFTALKEEASDLQYIKYGQLAFHEYFNYMLNRNYYDELPEEWKNLTFYSQSGFSNWLMAVTAQFYIKQTQDIREGYSEKVSRILKYIKHHYPDADLSNVQIADELGVSERYVRKLFKDELGITITDYLNAYRVEAAKELLGHEEEKVSRIHLKVGFSSSQYFATVFRKIVGMSPREYKRVSAQQSQHQ